VNPTGTNPDGDQTVSTVNDDMIDDQNPDGDQHTPLTTCKGKTQHTREDSRGGPDSL
jgi:hypothetical protein